MLTFLGHKLELIAGSTSDLHAGTLGAGSADPHVRVFQFEQLKAGWVYKAVLTLSYPERIVAIAAGGLGPIEALERLEAATRAVHADLAALLAPAPGKEADDGA